MNRTTLTPCLLMVALLPACAASKTAQNTQDTLAARPAKKPNVIFIMTDDLGYGHLGSYGQKKIKTPRLDEMAAEGTRFTSYYAGSTVCAPSRSSLLTGTHTGHTSVRGNAGGSPLVDSDVTIGEVLGPLGYQNAIIGKWGVGDINTEGVPWRQGFDYFFGYLHQVHAHYYYPYFLWKSTGGEAKKVIFPENEKGGQGRHTHEAIMDDVMSYLADQKDDKAPFFLYVPLTMPHAELQAPKDAMAEYDGQFEEPYPVVDNEHLTPQPKPRTAMAAMISRVDRDVGRLLDYLEASGLAENTLVFFTSDNGASDMGHDGSDLEFFEGNGPLRGHKRDLYEGGIRVPMIAWWPGKVPAGRVSDFAWASWDVFPTVVDLAGGTVDEKLPVDGQSVVPMLLGQPQEPKFPLYWEVGGESRLKQAVRDGNWKAVRLEPGGPVELYDLSEDLSETHDVSEQHPEIVAKLTAVMDATHTPQRTYPPEPVLYDKKPEDTGFVR